MHKQQLNIARNALDSLNKLVTIKDIHKEIKRLDDNSRLQSIPLPTVWGISPLIM